MRNNVAIWPLAALLLCLIIWVGRTGGAYSSLDALLIQQSALARAEFPAIVPIASLVTTLGDATVTVSVMLVAAALLLRRRQAALSLVLLVTVLGERALVNGLKIWVGRPRPTDGAFDVPSMAFPSGHAAHSMTVFLIVALLATPASWRRVAAICAITLSLLIGASRPLLGVHWPSDVIGGWAVGLLAVGIGLWLEKSGVPWLEAKHEIVGGHGDPLNKDETA